MTTMNTREEIRQVAERCGWQQVDSVGVPGGYDHFMRNPQRPHERMFVYYSASGGVSGAAYRYPCEGGYQARSLHQWDCDKKATVLRWLEEQITVKPGEQLRLF